MNQLAILLPLNRRLPRTISRALMWAAAMLFGMIVAPLASAQSAPYISYTTPNSYSVSYDCPVDFCYLMESDGWDWFYVSGSEIEYPNSGFVMYQDQPLGTYPYQVWGLDFSTGQMWMSPITEAIVPQPPPGGGGALKPYILPDIYPVGPWGDPYYYHFGWIVTNAHTNGCRLIVNYIINGNIVWVNTWNSLPTTGSVNIDKAVPGTQMVIYEFRCIGPGGTSKANGALVF
jgi:hypothetical protein